MLNPISRAGLQRGYRRLFGAIVCCAGLACQSSTASESREPTAEPGAIAQPATTAPPTNTAQPALREAAAQPAPAAQATPPLQGNTPGSTEPGTPAAVEPAVVKLTGGVASAPNAVTAAPKEKGADGKAPAAPPAAKSVQGTAVSEEAFSTWLQVQSPARAGAPVQLEAVLVAKPPYHCNAEYPHKFKLGAAPTGLAYPEETVKGMKVTPERSVLAIPVNAQSAGKPTVSGTLSFSVCTEERCLVEKRELSVALDVM